MALGFSSSAFWLLLALAAPVLYLLGKRVKIAWWPAAVIRFVLIGLVLLATFAPKTASGQGALQRQALVLDQSESLPEIIRNETLLQAETWREARGERLVVTFGVGEDAPDLVSALAQAQTLLGSQPGEIILASDGGVPAVVQVDRVVEGLAQDGDILNVLSLLPRSPANDLFLGPLWTPSDLWENMTFAAVLPVYAPASGEVQVQLWVDGQAQTPRTEVVNPGQNFLAFTVQAGGQGILTLEAQATWAGDPLEDNNRAFAAVEVFSSPRVMLVTNTIAQTTRYRQDLERNGIRVDSYTTEALPTALSDLDPYSVIILHNLLSNELTLEQMLSLQVFVTQKGRGIIFLGGNNSYTLGGYEGTILEEMLPVNLEPPPRIEQPPITFVMVLDRSSTMITGGARSTPVERRPINLAKEAAIRAIETLRAEDYLGVLTFSSGFTWDVPIRRLGSGLDLRTAQDAVSKVFAGGGTLMYRALEEAVQSLSLAKPTQALHILLLSDGDSDDGDMARFEALARLAKTQNITISTIAFGIEADTQTLKRIAEESGGRYFRVLNAEELPNILISESKAARAENVQLGQTSVMAGEVRHPVLTGFSLSDFPTVEGYNALSSKVEQGAEDILVSASFSDPLLSAWQLGLGRVVAWMGDLGEDWASGWRAWPGQGRFWTQVIRYALPDPSTGPAQAKVSVSPSTVSVDLQIENDAGVPVNLAYPEFAYVGADSTVTKLPMQQIAPGQYSLEFPRPPEGAYRAVISYLGEGGISEVAAPFVVTYPAELQPVDAAAGEANLLRWAGMTGGAEVSLDTLMAVEEQQTEIPPADLLRWLLLTLVVFWPLEIAIRRRWLPWS